MVAISLLAAVVAGRLRPALENTLGKHGARLGAGMVFLVTVVAGGIALPSVNEIPPDFPATALWRFREASVGVQAVLWTTIGLVFGQAAQRVMTGQPPIRRRLAFAGASE
jgi:hypothetical protein